MAASWMFGGVMLLLIARCYITASEDLEDADSRVIPLTSLSDHIEDPRLPRHVAPTGYRLEVQAYPEEGNFMGRVKINITCREPTDVIFLHAHPALNIRPTGRITVTKITLLKTSSAVITERISTSEKVLAIKRDPAKQWLMIRLAEKLKKARFYRIELLFDGLLSNNESEAFFRTSYEDHKTKEKRWLVATQMKPTKARSVFPCFDEPAYKVPFEISVARPNAMRAFSNMPVRATETIVDGWVWDHFMRTPPLATFSVGILITHMTNLPVFNVSNNYGERNVTVRIIGQEHFLGKLEVVAAMTKEALASLQDMFGSAFPLPELNIVALPHFTQRAPADQWGLVLFQEQVLTGKSSRWFLYNLLVTQWLGHLVTPHWWSDARLNQAIANYLATDHIIQTESRESWTSAVGYSVYYEFDQHREAAKQCDALKTTKTEWLLRMLSNSLTRESFEAGLREFMRERQYDTYFEDDVWASLTKQAWLDKTLEDPIRVEDIARSWIYQDRFPVLTITRDYVNRTASLKQHTFLRGRAQKQASVDLLWWIPVAFLTSDDLDLEMDPSTPSVTWIKAEREVTLMNLPDENKFVIVNPEETGMFLVNYDTHHWTLLSRYLDETPRDSAAMLPTSVRAKLLHDAWNLALGDEISFSTLFNMTLFLDKELDLAVWRVAFYMIDHLIEEIDGTIAAGKFKDYMSQQLATMYESLPPAQLGESREISLLREKAKRYLCSLAYYPCIEEATAAFKQWIQTAATDDSMISERYLCTTIRWNFSKEVKTGLQSVMASRGHVLLKQIARCLRDPSGMTSLLSEVLLADTDSVDVNATVVDADRRLVLDQFSTDAVGCAALFNFVKLNWDALVARLKKDSDIWDYLIEKAVGGLKTNRGATMLKDLYEARKGQFGSAEMIVREQLRLVKESADWTSRILPDINAWLDNKMTQYSIQY